MTVLSIHDIPQCSVSFSLTQLCLVFSVNVFESVVFRVIKLHVPLVS